MPIYKATNKVSPTARKLEMQNLILEISEKIAESEGWESVTMRRIASEIDKSLPIVYRHFTAKEEIIDIVAQRGYKKLGSLLYKIEESDASLNERVFSYFSTYCHFAIDNPAIYQAMYGMNGIATFQENQTEEGKLIYKFFLERLLPHYTNKGGINSAKLLLNLVWSTLHGYVSLANLDRMDYSREYIDKLVGIFTDMVLTYLKKD